MARPKGSKNKPKAPLGLPITPIQKVRIQEVKDVEVYEMRRAYWFMLAMEKKIMVDPTSVSPSAYMVAVRNYTDKMRVYKERKHGVKKRVDTAGSDSSSTEQSGSGGTGETGQTDLGARIPAVNPIT